jgi:hypothetical protein
MHPAGYQHLARLTTSVGLYEHALGTLPRPEHGMCVDDAARALVVTVREHERSPELDALCHVYLAYLGRALVDGGAMHNRSDDQGRWVDEASTDDHWGRALWAFGVAADSADAELAREARGYAARALGARATHVRTVAYAALGAARLLPGPPEELDARWTLHDAREVLPRPGAGHTWGWPEPRLSYANAVLPEAMIAIGRALRDSELREDGLALLGWLEDEQTVDGRLTLVPAGGRGPGDPRPGYDQQPIEVAALAEAAETALDATGDRRWFDLLARCHAWFLGANDAGVAVRDAQTGGGFDGLEDGSVNQNQGAESTLAWLATDQLARARHATAGD